MKGNEEKPRIGIFGRRNYGKSSLINFLTGQDIAIVSNTAGTTTDPVRKTMELLGVGPVVWVDTAGIDDVDLLGQMRVERTLEVLPQSDLALILFSQNRFDAPERDLVERCQKANVPFVLIYSQTDISVPNEDFVTKIEKDYNTHVFRLSTKDLQLREPLMEAIREALPESAYKHRSLLGGIVGKGDLVVMVTPIDSSAPEGRMILPQVQVLRDILDNDARALVCKETELEHTLAELSKPPQLVVTDSQVFGMVSKIVPQEVPLTSFSVVLARAKGLFDDYVKGTPKVDQLKDGDRVLMLESCTHNVTCEDIGRVKLPKLITRHTGKHLEFEAVAGLSALTRPVTDYAMVIQCGGCVVTCKQLAARLMPAVAAGIPVSNYGLMLAYVNGIFERSMQVFNSSQPSNTKNDMHQAKNNISIIVAAAQNMAIGKNNDLLWHISDDLKRFKALTSGHTVVMGRKTFDSLPKKPLPKRRNIVLTHDKDFCYEGVEVAHTIAEVLKMVGSEECFVMGGAAIYEQFLPFAERLFVTWVHANFEADVYFPKIDESIFRKVQETERVKDEPSGLEYSYADYCRIPNR